MTSRPIPAVGIVLALAAAIITSGYAIGRVSFGSASPTPSSPRETGSPAVSAAPSQVAAAGLGAGGHLLSDARPVTGPGQPPMLPESGGPYGARRTTGTSEVALTFDDGPDPSWTPQVLDLLRVYQVKATFCLVGANVQRFPELVRRIADAGHTLCNHTWDHDLALGTRSPTHIWSNLSRTTDAIKAAAPDSRVSYYRQPGGKWTASVVTAAHALGMTPLHWAVDPQDWRRRAAGSISAAVTGYTGSGDIVLMHDGGGDRSRTVAALRSILPYLTRRFLLCALPPGIDPAR